MITVSMSHVETPSGEPIKIYHASSSSHSGVEPSQVRVMLPMDANDRRIPVVQRSVQIPVSHEMTGRGQHCKAKTSFNI